MLRDGYRTLADDVRTGQFVVSAADWLLDNFHQRPWSAAVDPVAPGENGVAVAPHLNPHSSRTTLSSERSIRTPP